MTEVETVRRYISRCRNELECYSLVSINNVERIIIDGSQIVISKKWIQLTSNESQFTVVETVRMYIMDAAMTWGFMFICLRHWEVISQDQTYVNVRWKLKKLGVFKAGNINFQLITLMYSCKQKYDLLVHLQEVIT